MKLFKAVTTICFTALMSAVLIPSASGGDWNRKTKITFSGPVEIPGVHLTGWGVLPAGTYVFKILDSQSDRHIVQIFNQDETIIYATILAIPNYRLKATDKTVMTFSERPAGEPEALRAWFYPGRNWGEEFVYPKAKAMELAKDHQHAGALHGGRDSCRSRRTDQDGGRAGGSRTEAGAHHGRPADRRRGATCRGGYTAAGRE